MDRETHWYIAAFFKIILYFLIFKFCRYSLVLVSSVVTVNDTNFTCVILGFVAIPSANVARKVRKAPFTMTTASFRAYIRLKTPIINQIRINRNP